MPSLLLENASSGEMTTLLSGMVDPFAISASDEVMYSQVESPTDSESSAISDESECIDWLEEIGECAQDRLDLGHHNFEVENIC